MAIALWRGEIRSIRLITRRGNDWSARFALVVEAVNYLKVRSCLIDGQVVCCNEDGFTVFAKMRRRQRTRACLEGIVSKRLGSYYMRQDRDWLKFPNPEAPAVKREAEEDWRLGGVA